MDPILVLLAVPSAAVLAALAAHGVRNRGAGPTASYLAALFAYGAARAAAIRHLSRSLHASMPYLMSRPVVTVFGVSLQELLGWAVAVTLAWLISDRLLRALRRNPTPHRVTAVAGVALAVICLAVENAAIAAGWWTWTIPLARYGPIRVPPVALLDWGFVASDFLLPYLAFATRASWRTWAPALLLFPLHMYGHTWLALLPGPLPVTGNDLVHVGIVAYVLIRAVAEGGVPALPDPARERGRWLPAASALAVVAATVAASLLGNNPWGALASLPLLAMSAALPFRGPSVPAPPHRPSWQSHALRLAILGAAVFFLVAVRVPAMRRQQAFLAAVERGLAMLNRGDARGGEEVFRTAVAARPDHAGGHTFLAVALLRQERRREAREELDAALDREPTAGDALILSATLDVVEGQTARAAARAALGRRVDPDRAEFAYLEEVARGSAGRGKPPARGAVEIARRGGPAALGALATLAANLGDQATAAACLEDGRGAED